MQYTMTKGTWGVLAAVLAMLALALSLTAAQPALADDDLAAGNADMTAQATEATKWPLEVYLQHGTDAPKLVKSYTKEEFIKLASTNATAVSGLHWDGSSWYVTTAVKHVTLKDLLADANIHWAKGSTITYECYDKDTETSVSKSMTYSDVEELYFYPNTTRTTRSTDGGVKTGMVFGLDNAKSVIIGDSAKASDVQKAASSSSKNDEAVLPVMGSLKSEYDVPSGSTVSVERYVDGINKITITYSAEKQTMYRLYNPNSGEHFFTASTKERDEVKAAGWKYEGEAWTAPVVSNTPVYRVYNPNAGDHHYTTSLKEAEGLVKLGWKDEGIGWYSDDAKAVALLRLYNPNAKAGAHHFTTSTTEKDGLVEKGWKDEGIGWYGLA